MFTIRSLSPLKKFWVSRLRVFLLAYTTAGEWYTTFRDCETLEYPFPAFVRLKATNARLEHLGILVKHHSAADWKGAYMSIRKAEHPPWTFPVVLTISWVARWDQGYAERVATEWTDPLLPQVRIQIDIPTSVIHPLSFWQLFRWQVSSWRRTLQRLVQKRPSAYSRRTSPDSHKFASPRRKRSLRCGWHPGHRETSLQIKLVDTLEVHGYQEEILSERSSVDKR